MSQLVNFLPWRRRRRQRIARLWAVTFTSTVFLLVAGSIVWRVSVAADLRQASIWRQSDENVLAALVAGEKPLLLRQQRWQQAQARAQRRQQTRDWQPMLSALAENLPQEAWLTQLRWQQGRLELSGLARVFAALNDLETMLRAIPGFHLQPSGTMVRDAQGRWQFHYQLSKEPLRAP
ncbi:pilus assembly protein HofN [Kosakonia oryzendophytica]|uniref:Pilus assembly protein HofN n=1 Tax=Kosakonia oryzendophytica TaxID=1005665 RepID=A0A1C4E936_9ENTR|nr:PilN domain-containing protein [Kosakonia oryzendophytica]TDT51433.1 pilus assembly protein HofN [Enterobacter sp. AG5470]SCC40147.1 pilus assembly protein HofN [Kosakonia oryzendophytica]